MLHALESLFDLPGQRSSHNLIELFILAQRRGILTENGSYYTAGRFARKGTPPSEHFVQHHSPTPDVGALVYSVALHLLRRHVVQGANERTGNSSGERN